MKYSSSDTWRPMRSTRESAEKLRLEEAMRVAPADQSLRQAYFDLLGRVGAGVTGLGWAILPELSQPLFFRHGSSDMASMAQIFLQQRYGAPLRAEPQTILDLGAYVGYAAVYFAQRFPDAKILCVEPMAAAFRVLLLNTLPYQNIICRNVAVWGHAGSCLHTWFSKVKPVCICPMGLSREAFRATLKPSQHCCSLLSGPRSIW